MASSTSASAQVEMCATKNQNPSEEGLTGPPSLETLSTAIWNRTIGFSVFSAVLRISLEIKHDLRALERHELATKRAL